MTALCFAEYGKLALPRNQLRATLHHWRLVLAVGEAVLDLDSAVAMTVIGSASCCTLMNCAIHYLDAGLVALDVTGILVTFLLDLMAATGFLVIDSLHASEEFPLIIAGFLSDVTAFGEFELHPPDACFGGDFFIAQFPFIVTAVWILEVNLGLALDVIVRIPTFFWTKVVFALHQVLAWLLTCQL